MGTRRRELISGDLSSVGSTVLAQIEIDLRIVASGRGEFLKVYSFRGRVNVPKMHSCHCAKNSENAYVVSVPKKDVHVCNVPKFSPAQCWQSAKFSAICCQSAKFIMECSWCQKSTDKASMNSCVTLDKT